MVRGRPCGADRDARGLGGLMPPRADPETLRRAGRGTRRAARAGRVIPVPPRQRQQTRGHRLGKRIRTGSAGQPATIRNGGTSFVTTAPGRRWRPRPR